MPTPAPTIQPALTELERAYAKLAPTFRQVVGIRDEAQRPVILIQHRGRRAALGWMAPKRWTERDQERGDPPPLYNEITLAAESLAAGAEAAFGTLAHEMVHHFNALRGVRDCNINQYHTVAFRELATAIGLTVEKMGHRGWSDTRLGPALQRVFRGLKMDDAKFAIFRTSPAGQKAPTRMVKWVCGCGRIFRAAVEHHAQCLDCRELYVREGNARQA